MRVFLDTNVILEFFIEREDVRTAAQLFNRLKDEKAEMYMSVGSFYTMMFLIDKYLRKELGLTGEVRIATLRSLAVNSYTLARLFSK
jgi:predicted nucleic-acid-binding protein